jgi:uncharacterized protein (DUF362 family)
MKKSIVCISKGTHAEQMVDEVLSLLGGVEKLIRPNSTVVVKPNAGHVLAPETGGNTSPEMVTAVIKAIRKAKPKEIIVAESAAIGGDTLECLEVSGIGKAAEDAGADKIIDIKREKDLIKIPIRDARSDINHVLLPRFLVEADHIVNLPIFKPHVSMVFTCALKNIKGVVQDKVHHRMHQTDLAAAMLDVWSVVRPDLSIVDLIHPQEGFGPINGIPVDFGCVVAGIDPVAIDATCCRMVGLDIKEVYYFKAARDRGFGNFDEKLIEIRGKKIEDVFKQLWLPYLGGFAQWPEYKIDAEGACSSCQGLVAFTMERLKSMGEYDKNAGITILLGPKKKLPEGVPQKDLILVGSCLKKFRDQGVYVEGCPPSEPGPMQAIVTREESRLDLDDEASPRMASSPESRAEMQKVFAEYQKKLRLKALGR